MLILLVTLDASDPGAPTALTYFCSTCIAGGAPAKPGSIPSTNVTQPCPPGIINPGLELTVITYPNNTGVINHDTFVNCPAA